MQTYSFLRVIKRRGRHPLPVFQGWFAPREMASVTNSALFQLLMATLLEANSEEAAVAETLAAHSFGIQLRLLEATSDPSKARQDPHQSQYYIFIFLDSEPSGAAWRERRVRGVCALSDITNGLLLQRRILEQGLPNLSMQWPRKQH